MGAAGGAAEVGNSLDPDMLDERARALLDYVDPRDLILAGSTAVTTGQSSGRRAAACAALSKQKQSDLAAAALSPRRDFG